MVVTLKNSVPAVTGEAGREAGHGDPDGDAQGAGQGEHQVGGDEAPLAEAGLRHVQAEAEGHQRLVHHHGHEDGEQLVPVALHADGDTLEHGVEGECDHEHEAAQGGVLEHGVVHMGVAVVVMVVVRLARLVLVVVMVVVVVAVGGVVGGGVPRQQGRSLLRPGLRGPGLLHRQRRLLDQQDQQEAETHDELGQGVVDIYIVLVLHLFQYLKRDL